MPDDLRTPASTINKDNLSIEDVSDILTPFYNVYKHLFNSVQNSQELHQQLGNKMAHEQRCLLYVDGAMGLIDNGGFRYYFECVPAEELTHHEEAFTEIGLPEFAAIMRAAESLSRVFDEEYCEILNNRWYDGNEDGKVYEQAVIAYVQANWNKFIDPTR